MRGARECKPQRYARPSRVVTEVTAAIAIAAFAISAFSVAAILPGSASAQEDNEVYVADLSQTTDRRDGLTADSVEYLERVISDAGRADAAVAVELNTSGGRLDQTEEMINSITEAEQTPVFVYVPQGARAESAGTFLMMASDVAAMAPQSRTGAATPVSATGEDLPSDLGEKATNSAVSLITGLAEAHDRNADWAEEAVSEAAAVNSEEALQMDIVEYVEPDLQAVLEAADGATVEPKGITLDTAQAELVQNPLTFSERWGFSPWLLIVPGILILLGAAGLARAAIRSSRQRVTVGTESMIGEVGDIRRRVSAEEP
ncbi:MAG: hypothetical protein L0G70_06920, partial [Rubrobacter sp.]|nr:hypothetical protein [Rubrobacter sp.]